LQKIFFPVWKARLNIVNDDDIKSIGNHFYTVKFPSPPSPQFLSQSIFSRYWVPVEYMWPTNSTEKGFIEKCAQGVSKKFDKMEFHNIIVFSIDRKKQSLASNLRGRLLQILKENMSRFSSEKAIQEWTKNPSAQPSHHKVLIVTISDKCIWAGICPLNVAGSVFGGGRHYVGVSSSNIASRAAAKLVEAIEFLKLKNVDAITPKKWLELGAAPGGITHELAYRKNEVWAVDKADLEGEIAHNPLVHFYKMDAREFKVKEVFDSIFCDLNGPAHLSAEICSQKAPYLSKKGIIIHTFKIHHIQDFESELKYILQAFEKQKCSFIAARHLYNNKQEITLFFKNY